MLFKKSFFKLYEPSSHWSNGLDHCDALMCFMSFESKVKIASGHN